MSPIASIRRPGWSTGGSPQPLSGPGAPDVHCRSRPRATHGFAHQRPAHFRRQAHHSLCPTHVDRKLPGRLSGLLSPGRTQFRVRLKVDFDVTLTEAPTGLYRMLGRLLPGYEAAKSRQLFRHFLNAPAEVEIESGRVQVTLPKRAHNPLLINAGLGEKATPIPWWDNRPLQICFR